jgi:hypothetical protein
MSLRYLQNSAVSVGGENVLRMSSNLRKRWSFIVLATGFLVITIAILCSYFSSTPKGVYFDPQIGAVGGGYWMFEAGQVHLKTAGSSEFIDIYAKSNAAWVSNNGKFILKPSLLGIEVVDTTDSSLNRYLPRRGFVWVCECQNALGFRKAAAATPEAK